MCDEGPHLEPKYGPFSAQKVDGVTFGAPTCDATPSLESLKAYLVGIKVVLGLNAKRTIRTGLVGRELEVRSEVTSYGHCASQRQ